VATAIAVMIDGGFARTNAQRTGRTYNPAFIERLGRACGLVGAEDIRRILYYDCALYSGSVRRPISGTPQVFTSNDGWLHDLSHRELFAVRRGVLKFRGWIPKTVPLIPGAGGPTDNDFKPDFEQKGVDMRIGLDMANYSANRSVDLIALMTNDTDCIPAMKYARRAGLQVALVCLPGCSPAPELLSHCDYKRDIAWP
jgi:uncharacterized LabA/DUF88 family protein